MAKAKLTAGRVADFKCESGKHQSFLWDTLQPGLGLRVTETGAKAYIFQSKLAGKTIRITIGDPQTWLLDAPKGSSGKGARQEANRLQHLINEGKDPRQIKAEQLTKAEAAQVELRRQSITLSDVWPIYLQARKGRWSERHYQDHLSAAALGGEKKKRGTKLTTAGPLASLLPLKLADLNCHKIAQWVEQESAIRPTYASLSFRMLRAFIGWAAEHTAYREIIPPDAISARVVREALPKNQAKEGDSLQREQLDAWFAAVRSLPNPVISAYLQALLLTGARREEMAGLRWEDVDFQWRSLTIRDKVEGTRIIPLTLYVSGLIAALPRRNEWVFSSLTAANGRLAEPRIAHNKALAIAGLPHISLHGLRRSFGTLCEWVEVPSGISAQIMGHKPSALAEKHYRRRPPDLLRKWHEIIEAWILEQGNVKPIPSGIGLMVVAT